MVDGIVKIAGSLFIGGIGLCLCLAAGLIIVVFIREVITKTKER